MSRLFGATGVFLAILVANFTTVASAQDAFVTRIEPRPFYGATITIEEGVRVFRPLPPTQQIIINPTQAPLNLSTSFSVERRSASENGASNGGASNGNGENGGYSNGNGYGNGDTTSYPIYGSALSDQGYGARHGGDSGYKGRRHLKGFAAHGVRVNGQHAPYTSGHYGRTGFGHKGYANAQSYGKAMPLHLPPIGYGAPKYGLAYGGINGRHQHGFHYGHAQRGPYVQAQRWPVPHPMPHNVKVYRPQQLMMRLPAPVVSHVMRPPMVTHAPHAPIHAPAGHAAPRHGGQGHAGQGHVAPAGRMGMGMGRR